MNFSESNRPLPESEEDETEHEMRIESLAEVKIAERDRAAAAEAAKRSSDSRSGSEAGQSPAEMHEDLIYGSVLSLDTDISLVSTTSSSDIDKAPDSEPAGLENPGTKPEVGYYGPPMPPSTAGLLGVPPGF